MDDKCMYGHPFDHKNTRYYLDNGVKKRQCIECNNRRHRESYAANIEKERKRCRDYYRKRKAKRECRSK